VITRQFSRADSHLPRAENPIYGNFPQAIDITKTPLN